METQKDVVTLLHVVDKEDQTYAKKFCTEGEIKDQKRPYLHTPIILPVENITDLSRVLHEVENNPKICIIRGNPDEHCNDICRRTHLNFSDKAHHWVLFDFDDLPEGINPKEVVDQYLPAEFHSASFHWQYSGGHGFKTGTRIHIWFWMDRTVSSAEWKQWHQSYGFKKEGDIKTLNIPVDPALFNPVQVHITSNPILVDIDDPVDVRSGFYQGTCGEATFRLGSYELPEHRKIVKHKQDKGSHQNLENITPRTKGIIGLWNRMFSVTKILEMAGYQQIGDRYLHPRSESGAADTVINSGTHAYAFSPYNPLFEQGTDKETGEILNRNNDAFDCFRILHCKGEMREAMKHAAAILKQRNPTEYEVARGETA